MFDFDAFKTWLAKDFPRDLVLYFELRWFQMKDLSR